MEFKVIERPFMTETIFVWTWGNEKTAVVNFYENDVFY